MNLDLRSTVLVLEREWLFVLGLGFHLYYTKGGQYSYHEQSS